MIRVGGNGMPQDGETQEREPGWGTGRVSRAGLFSRSAAVLGALGGVAVGATELAAASNSQRTPAHDREIFGFVTLWQQIEALDNKVDDAVQSAMLIDTARLIDRGTTWFLR